MRRSLPRLAALMAAIVFISAALITNHHALAVFFNAGQPTGCGGG